MKPATRLVCGGCLRSVEWGLEDEAPSTCEACGWPLDQQATEERPREGHLPLEVEETSDWSIAAAAALAGELGRFHLRESLGNGGFGQVFRAYDPRLDRDVALKVLRQGGPKSRALERFFREARATAQLDHPNIVPLLDAGCDGGRCWIAYQYVAGPTLDRLRDTRPIDTETAVRIIRALADALDHAHGRGVFHRDLKPANVILDGAGRPRLIDFGLARRTDFESTLTREGTILGTPAYMSPEQAAGHSHQADARSDVYSLGVMLHELVCGRRPTELPSTLPPWLVESPASSSSASQPESEEATLRLPQGLDRICRRALADEPSKRYPDARALAIDLDAWLRRLHRKPSVRRWLARGVAVSLLVVATVAVTLAASGRYASGLWMSPIPLSTSPVQPLLFSQPDETAPSVTPPEANPSEAAPLPAPKVLFVGNRAGNHGRYIYHLPNCPYVLSMNPDNRVGFTSAQAARDQGFIPCSRCLLPPAHSRTRTESEPLSDQEVPKSQPEGE